MDKEDARQLPSASGPVAPDHGVRGPGAPPVLDAEFKVVSPTWGWWRACRDGWWALGPYLAYCTALWGLAALIGWLIDRGRAG